MLATTAEVDDDTASEADASAPRDAAASVEGAHEPKTQPTVGHGEPPRVVPFASSTPLRALEPGGPAPVPAVPSSMRWALIASVGAALLSTAVALYVVTREHDEHLVEARPVTPEGPHAADGSGDAAIPSVTAPAALAASPAQPVPEEPAALAWPDIQLEALPPVGAAPEAMGQSMGSPRDGALLRPTQLPPGRGYVIRNPQTAWGTANTIEHLKAAIDAARAQHPDVHQLLVGDISTRRGGPLPGHQSHQAGRDVDLGLWYRPSVEDGAPRHFVEGSSKTLDRRATFDLVRALAATADEPDGVELIVLDYNLQRVLRRAGQARGVPEVELEALFQFPHGPSSRHGLVRHMPAHRDHLHVRFKCPTGDRYCRDPLIGFGGMEAPEGPPPMPSGI